ncbi:hypothetical protein V8F20_002986 [Naviculisporaceae sp. PSN 640]
MADPLSVASGITALMGLCGNIAKLISTAKGASKDLRWVDIEIKAFSVVLEELKVDVLAGVEDATSVRSGVSAALEGCETTLEEVTKGLEGLSISSSCATGSGKRRKLKDAVKWTWKKDDTEKLLTAIQQHKTSIMAGVLGETYRDIKEIKRTVTAVKQSLSDQELSKVVGWVQKDVNPTPIHNTACSNRNEEDNTGEWMLRMSEWHAWIDSETMPTSRSLWVHGIPGAGKTILASFLIEQCLSKVRSMHQEAAQCIYYYCSYRHNRDESESFLRWLLSQLCRAVRHIPPRILELYRMDHHPDIKALMDAVEDLLDSVNLLYVVVDGADESKEPRDQFLDILVRLATAPQFDKIRLLVTSRLYSNIRVRLEPCAVSIAMSNEEVDKDIRKFVTREIDRTWKEPWRLLLKEKVVKKLVAGAQGMFQWAACQVKILHRKRNPSAIEQALKELPKDLDETYDRILGEIPEECRALARNVFIWLHGYDRDIMGEYCLTGLPAAFLIRWLNLHEFPQSSSSTENSFLQLADIVDICGCLITVHGDHSGSYDYIVRFSHYTVLEYLLSDRVRGKSDATSRFAFSAEEGVSDHLRQVLTVIPSLNLCFSINPGDISEFERYIVNVAMETFVLPSPEYRAAIALGGLWAHQLAIDIPRLFRYQTHTYGCDLFLVHWDGDETTADSVRLCELVMNCSEWKVGGDNLATRFLRENGSRDLFRRKIRGFGLDPCSSSSCAVAQLERSVAWSQCFREPPLATVGIQLLAIMTDSNLFYIHADIKSAFENLAVLSLEYVEQATILHTMIPLHFGGYTCVCCSKRGGHDDSPDQCALLDRVLNHQPGVDLNNTGFHITPLQLAVYCWNLEMARSLIKNGADVNVVGLKDGKGLPESTIYCISERWSQATPLHILRNAGYGLDEFERKVHRYANILLKGGHRLFIDMYPSKRNDRQDLEQLLLDNGAVDNDGTGAMQTAAPRRL